MSYLVLARKWRPQNFEEVVGQDPITRALQNAISTRRVAHAYLFAGPRGVGKTSVARILAKALNCEKGPSGHPCDDCPSCREVRDGISVDVLEIDGASNRGIDEIRELRENVNYLPAKNRSKIYIIDEVHMLTKEAFNALLKTLEEPPAHVIFVFATTEPNKIPLTLLSRCQRYDFRRIPQKTIVEHLQRMAAQENVEIGAKSLHLIAREAEGSLRDAQSLLDQVFAFGGAKISDQQVVEALGVIDRRLLHRTIRALADRDKVELLQVIEEAHAFGYDLKEFCGELTRLTRDLLVLKCLSPKGGDASRLIDLPEEEIRDLTGEAGKLSSEDIHALFRSLLSAHDEIIRSSFPRLILEMTFIRLAERGALLSVSAALEKLREMEERLSGNFPVADKAPAEKPAEKKEIRFEPQPAPDDEEIRSGEERDFGPAPPAGEFQETWRELVNFLKRKKPPLASVVEHGTPLALKEDLLEIGYAEKSFYLARMQEADTRSALEKFAGEFFRHPVRVRISALRADVLPSADAENGGEGTPKDPGRQKEDALNHPLVKEAINVFGGRVIEIKP
jgi:DNA polymerase III subunit gamma/tau